MSALTYLPATGPGSPTVLYVAKGSETAQRLAECCFGAGWRRSVSLLFGWDDGSYAGRTLHALTGPAEHCKSMFILTDLSWRGLVSACRAIRLCKRARPVLLGIDDEWLSVATKHFPNAGYIVDAHREDLAIRLTPRERNKVLAELSVGSAACKLLESGHEVHLDAFAHAHLAADVRKLLRDRRAAKRKA